MAKNDARAGTGEDASRSKASISTTNETGITTMFVRRKSRGKMLKRLTDSASVPAWATSDTAVICHR